MGHYSLIALVTATIHDLIGAGLRDHMTGATIRTDAPPAETCDGNQASLCLRRLSVVPQLRNEDLPTRSSDGVMATLPRTALALHYLLSFDGRDALASQVMLGKIVSILHAVPVLTAQRLAGVLGQDGLHPALHGVPPPDPLVSIKLVAEYPAEEELWKLWRAFGALPRPSLHYVAAPILIDADMVAEGAKTDISADVAVRV